jgi:hypothetical protein
MAKSKPTNFNEYLQLVPEQVQLKLKELEHCILQVWLNIIFKTVLSQFYFLKAPYLRA